MVFIKYFFMQMLKLESIIVMEIVKIKRLLQKKKAGGGEAIQQLTLRLVLHWLKAVLGLCQPWGRLFRLTLAIFPS